MTLRISDGLVIRPKPRPRTASTTRAVMRDVPTTAFRNPLGLTPVRQGRGRSWCWAACGVMLVRYLDEGSQLRRCDLVKFVRKELHGRPGNLECCKKPDDKPACVETVCQNADEIDAVLGRFLHLGFARSLRLEPDALKAEINAGRPVQVAFEWDGSTPENVRGHVIIVQGWTDVPRATTHGTETETFFHIIDPLQEYDEGEGPPLNNQVSYDSLRQAYGSGRWSFSWAGLRLAED